MHPSGLIHHEVSLLYQRFHYLQSLHLEGVLPQEPIYGTEVDDESIIAIFFCIKNRVEVDWSSCGLTSQTVPFANKSLIAISIW